MPAAHTPRPSRHRHISFTAHYTGYVWYQMGISHPAFATAKGRLLTLIAHPFETFGEKVVGGSMRSTLKARHTMLDNHLTALIQQHPDLQVLEIAAGLSPRGWWFRQHYSSITYRELDLPDMAATKQAALLQVQPDSPQVLSADLFSYDFQQVFTVFDPAKPLVIISEGLINYFTKNLLQQLLQSIVGYGATFQQLYYLTDLYPEPVKNRFASLIWSSSKLLKFASRSAFSFHFQNPAQVKAFFQQAGFTQVKVVQPTFYFSEDQKHQTAADPQANEHFGDLVWMVQAQP